MLIIGLAAQAPRRLRPLNSNVRRRGRHRTWLAVRAQHFAPRSIPRALRPQALQLDAVKSLAVLRRLRLGHRELRKLGTLLFSSPPCSSWPRRSASAGLCHPEAFAFTTVLYGP